MGLLQSILPRDVMPGLTTAIPPFGKKPSVMNTLMSDLFRFKARLRGRHMTTLCVDAALERIWERHQMAPEGRPVLLRKVFPSLRGTKIGGAAVGEPRAALIPAVREGSPPVSPLLIRMGLNDVFRWPESVPYVPKESLRLVVSFWLCSGAIGVPWIATGNEQDWFLSCEDHELAVCNQASKEPMTWAGIRAEVDKLPIKYFSLLVLCTTLSTEIQEHMHGAGILVVTSKSAFVPFPVSEETEIIIANPDATKNNLFIDLFGADARKLILNGRSGQGAGEVLEERTFAGMDS